MGRIQRLRHQVDQFFFVSDGQTEFLAFFRVSAGIVILLHFCSTILDFDTLFSSHSIVPQDIMSAFTPDWVITLPKIVQYLEKLGLSEPHTLLLFKGLFITCCLTLILGIYGRISAALLLLLQLSVTKGGSFFVYGVDFFTSMSLFYLILFPADRYFSIRTYFRQKPLKAENFMPVKRMFQLHLSIAYFFSGFDKLLGFNWRNGEAIWKAINLPYANRDFFFDFTWLANHPLALIIIGWSTVFIEMLYPVFIWIVPTRKLWLFLTVMMHVGIALALNLYYFSAIMIVWNLTNFYFEPGKAFDLVKRLRLDLYKKNAQYTSS